MREERIAVNSPALRRHLGKCEIRSGAMIGVSGLELKYDAALAGRPGRFSVLLDRWRRWIPASWQLLEPPRAGSDVTVDLDAGAGEGVLR